MIDILTNIDQEFPVLQQQVRGNPLIYLDNGATTQKPTSVLDRMHAFSSEENATVHRGIYYLSQQATRYCDNVRQNAQRFIHAESSDEIIFVRGTTEAINLVSYGVANALLEPGQEILISEMEHHSNIVPWQQICKHYDFQLKMIPFLDDGQLDLEAFSQLLSKRTGFVSLVHVSNSLGTINPIKDIIDAAHKVGAYVLIDGAQSIAHMPINVQELDCDFFCFSGHKMYGPTGVCILYGKAELLNRMPPYQSGGDMIDHVAFEGTRFAPLPYKFEAGTPAIESIIGLGEAIQFIERIGWDKIEQIESDLTQYLEDSVGDIEGVKRFGITKPRAGLVSFILDGCHAYDVGTLLDQQGVCVRVGHHCTQPVMTHYGIDATIRASIACYNTRLDIDGLCKGLRKAQSMLK